jgi:nicotinate-nucleotide adenylyltransferase
MSMRVAIFGGTFDPIHNAHLAIARSAASHFNLDLVFFVPGAHPPHKAGITHAPYDDRVSMAELACAGEPRFKVSRMEQNTHRSYSVDTIEKFRARLSPDDQLYFLIGADAFAEIHTWRRWREVAAAVCFLVVSRPGHRYHRPPEICAERLDTVKMPVSSSEVRRVLGAGGSPHEVPPAVLDYILERGLYRGYQRAGS